MNALDDIGTSDTVLTSVVLVLFVLGFFLGILELSQTVGILILSVLGGLALGIRIILLRDGLLLPDPSLFFVNWLLIALCGLSCGILVVWKRRIGVVSSGHSLRRLFHSRPSLAHRMHLHRVVSLWSWVRSGSQPTVRDESRTSVSDGQEPVSRCGKHSRWSYRSPTTRSPG